MTRIWNWFCNRIADIYLDAALKTPHMPIDEVRDCLKMASQWRRKCL